MKKFLIRSAVFVFLVASGMVALFLLPLPYNHDLSAILNKRDLLKDGARNRIIFVGGSGLYSALDSAMIEQQLGRPVRNIGLWAGFAITPLLTEIESFLLPGDIIVLIPEYGITFDSYNEQSRKWIFTLAPGRNLKTLYCTAQDRFKIFGTDMAGLERSKIEALPHAIRGAITSRSLGPLVKGGYVDYDKYFNKNGDSWRIFPTAQSLAAIGQRGQDYFSSPSFRDQPLSSVNAFIRRAEARGVQTFFIFPAYPEEEYRRFEDGARFYEQRLRRELQCAILGSPQDFLYPYLMFTDTIHHLGLEGKRKRTEKIITLLKARLSGPR